MGKCDGLKKRSKKGVVKRKDRGLKLRPSPKSRVNRQEKQLNVKVARRAKASESLSENLALLEKGTGAARRGRGRGGNAGSDAPEKLMVVPPNNKGGVTLTRKDKRFSKAANALSENLMNLGNGGGKEAQKARRGGDTSNRNGKKNPKSDDRTTDRRKGAAATRAQVCFADDGADAGSEDAAAAAAEPRVGMVAFDEVRALVRGVCGGRKGQ